MNNTNSAARELSSLYLATGYKCNHSCVFCPCGRDNRKHLTYDSDEVIKVLDGLLEQKSVGSITISGGEPTIQPCLLPVLKRLAQTDIAVEILSNGDTLSNLSVIKNIASAFPAERLSFITAFHSHIPQIHEQANRSKGSFSRSVQGLHNLEQFGISYSVKHIFNKLSYQELTDFTRWFLEEFPKAEYLIFTGMDLCGLEDEKCADAAVSCRDVEKPLACALEYISQQPQRLHRKVIITDFPLCRVDPIYWSFVRLRKAEKEESYIGLSSDGSSYSELTHSSDCAPFFSPCGECDVRSVCPGWWSASCRFFGDEEASPIHLFIN